jgi:hypothetical protein
VPRFHSPRTQRTSPPATDKAPPRQQHSIIHSPPIRLTTYFICSRSRSLVRARRLVYLGASFYTPPSAFPFTYLLFRPSLLISTVSPPTTPTNGCSSNGCERGLGMAWHGPVQHLPGTHQACEPPSVILTDCMMLRPTEAAVGVTVTVTVDTLPLRQTPGRFGHGGLHSCLCHISFQCSLPPLPISILIINHITHHCTRFSLPHLRQEIQHQTIDHRPPRPHTIPTNHHVPHHDHGTQTSTPRPR